MCRQSPLGPVDPSFQALSGRLKFTARRHKFNKDSLSLFVKRGIVSTNPFARHGREGGMDGWREGGREREREGERGTDISEREGGRGEREAVMREGGREVTRLTHARTHTHTNTHTHAHTHTHTQHGRLVCVRPLVNDQVALRQVALQPFAKRGRLSGNPFAKHGQLYREIFSIKNFLAMKFTIHHNRY